MLTLSIIYLVIGIATILGGIKGNPHIAFEVDTALLRVIFSILWLPILLFCIGYWLVHQKETDNEK